MTHRRPSTALLLFLASLSGAGHAAEPEFKVGLVMESREYGERCRRRSAACAYRVRRSGRAA
jgi:hypothetical protein